GITRARHFQCRTFGRSVTPPPRLDARGRNEEWRRGEDLNPRGTFWAPIRFRVGRLQPGSATPPRIAHDRFVSKNPRSSAPHSLARTPPTVSTRWLKRASSSSRWSDSTEPALGPAAPRRLERRAHERFFD